MLSTLEDHVELESAPEARVKRTGRRMLSVAIAILLGAETTGCTSWRPTLEPTPALGPDVAVDQVRVRLLDGTSEVVTSPRLEADTLVGTIVSGDQRTDVRIPPDRISGLELRETSTARTAALALGVAAAVMAFSAAVGGFQRITSGL